MFISAVSIRRENFRGQLRSRCDFRRYYFFGGKHNIMGTLAGKIAVITGGNSGIGLSTAKTFAAEGAQVVITGRRQQAVEEAAAIGAFARSWAIELKSRGIRVNVLSPGPVDTAILDKLGIPIEKRGPFEKAIAEAIPLGRMGQPEELAKAALFLASDASCFITGVNLRVDGGMALL
jgi:NAD(P)-dependent dehydrogenase (short-subunit alcohol dehydrogenase family)